MVEKNIKLKYTVGFSTYYLVEDLDGTYSIYRNDVMILNSLSKKRAYELSDLGKRFGEFTVDKIKFKNN